MMKMQFAFCLFTALLCVSFPAFASDFRDLDAKFSYDGHETVTVELCNPTEDEIFYFDGFEKGPSSWVQQNSSENEDAEPLATLAYVANMSGEIDRKPVNTDVGQMVTLWPGVCNTHDFPVYYSFVQEGRISRDEYNFQIFIIIYEDLRGKRPLKLSPDFPDIQTSQLQDQRWQEYAQFESPVYTYRYVPKNR